MSTSTYYNLRKICHTDTTDFTDYQGIGADPLFKRWESVYSVIEKHIDAKYQGFLARPEYNNGLIDWYASYWQEEPELLINLPASEKDRYTSLKNETLDHYNKVLGNLCYEEHEILSKALKYVEDQFIYCYDERVILVAWGMRPNPYKRYPIGTLTIREKVPQWHDVTFDAGLYGKITTPRLAHILKRKGALVSLEEVPEISVQDGYKLIGWSPEPNAYLIEDNTTFVAQYEENNVLLGYKEDEEDEEDEVVVTFVTDKRGRIEGTTAIAKHRGDYLNTSELPIVIPNAGYEFIRWSPSIDQSLETDTRFIAEYEEKNAIWNFLSGDNGRLEGKSYIERPFGSTVNEMDIPRILPNNGYEFTGWSDAIGSVVDGDKTFTAQYKKLPWYSRLWSFVSRKGCLKWLLWLIILLLFLWGLLFLFGSDFGCSRRDRAVDAYGNPILKEDSIAQIDKIKTPDGDIIDNNGSVGIATDGRGNIPDHAIVAPIIDNGILPPTDEIDAGVNVISNRLNIYFEDEDVNLSVWAKAFKKAYPSDLYQIIGADPNVPMIQIQIPESERDMVREEINSKIPDIPFFVVDESIIRRNGGPVNQENSRQRGWHLKAVNVYEAWKVTKGDPEIVIAIVDDGIEADHPIFEGRLYRAYNVFTQNRYLSVGEGHGTHVAALAAGSDEFIAQGVAGIAPHCKIMPIQVFDNEFATFSSITSGIMYAINNGADVVNISVGPNYQGLDGLPLSDQAQISNTFFKNEERVWLRILTVAERKNVLLVFATGNDNILATIPPQCRFPNKTINVASVNPERQATGFTNYANGANISAPGVDIYSAYTGKGFKMFDGTSMSAPIVAGALALLKSVTPKMTVQEAIRCLQMTGASTDQYVPPMLQVDKALSYLIDSQSVGSITNIEDEANLDSSIAGWEEELKHLRQKRDRIDQEIKEIENKINNKESHVGE